MAINPATDVQADIGPLQNRAFAPVDIKQAGPDGETSGKAMVVRLDATSVTALSSSLATAQRSTAVSTGSGTVASSTTVVTLLAANSLRKAATFNNPGAAILLLDSSTAPTTAVSQAQLAAGGGYYELPQPVYQGAISGIWSSTASGATGCIVREFI